MSANASPSLIFCSSSSKAKPEAMQVIREKRSPFVGPCFDLPNGLMWPYLGVPTYLMELFIEFFTVSWAVERWNLSSVSLLLSLFFLESIRENIVTMILWLLNIRLGMWFLTLAQQMFLLILPSKG
jgi:hypothetical protein